MSLTQAQLIELKRLLEQKRAELTSVRGRSVVAGTRSNDGAYPDPMDAATRAEEEQELLDLADREGNLLAEVEHALAKLDAGTYGVSELSKQPIPYERLRVVPWARLTTDEEERRERHQGGQ
jgi:DnaK suppressor protein